MATQTITTSGDIPKVLEPYYLGRPAEGGKPAITGLLERGIGAIYPTLEGTQAARAAYETQFAPLYQAGLMGAGSVAPMSEFQQQTGRELAGITLPDQYSLATQAGQQAAGAYQSVPGVAAPQLTQFQMGPARQFTGAEAQAYMSPYQQAVTDIQQRGAIEAARQAQLGGNLASARQGTYGGARQALLQAQRESGLRQQLGDIQAQGLQSAFQQAQQQFERDRASQFNVGQQNLAAQLGVQQLGAGQSLEAQRANQAAQLQGASGLAGLAQTMGGLGTQQLAGQLDITKTLGAYGDLQRGITQQQMDAQRQALMDQAQYGQTQVGQLSNLLRGIPLSDTTQQNTTPPPSFASQLTGLGLTGLSLYNLLGNK